MSKTLKALLTTIATFCFTSPILLTTMMVQAETPAIAPDFEPDAPDTPGQQESIPEPEPLIETPVTTVSCKDLATVVTKGDKSAVLITWKTTEFGGSYTPQERCRVVSARFNSKVQANDGSLKGLMLTNGPVNNRMVICALRPGEYECNTENMLFTLKRENENNAGAVLGRLLNISVTGSGSAIEENSGQQVKVDMGRWASNNLRRAGTANNNTRPTTPSYRPSTNTGF